MSEARRSPRPPARRQAGRLSRFLASPLWREVRTVVLFALTALLLVSLLTHDARDPAPIFGAEGGARGTANAAGPVGAFLAAAAFQLIGVAAYLLPLLTFFLATNRWTGAVERAAPARVAGAALFVVTATGLLHLWFGSSGPAREASPGGLLGSVFGGWLAGRLHGVGASIVLVAALLLAMIMTTRLTLKGAASGTTRSLAGVAPRVRSGLEAVRERWRDWVVKRNAARRRAAAARRGDRRPVVTPPPRPASVESTTAGTPTRGATDAVTPVPTPPPVRDRPTPPSLPAEADAPSASAQLTFRDLPTDFELPPTTLLNPFEDSRPADEEELVETARLLTAKLQEFGVGGSVVAIHPGPVITTYEFKPDAGIKYSRITNLVDDLSLAMKAESVRIDRMAGRSTVGIEVPNRHREVIPIRELLESNTFARAPGRLPLVLGKTIDGQPYVSTLERMPHLLIAGATGAGKSVALNTMITSILFRASPADVKFIFIDPKMLELGIYEDIPHLICPVVTEPTRAARALKWATLEMTRRYETLFGHGVRNLEQYNRMIQQAAAAGEQMTDDHGEVLESIPYIIIVIDELADLMMVSSKEVEAAIQRLAQMARAVGIHLIVATQRPSVDVLTGVIKANFPCRVAFRVSSRTDSNVILDQKGAERLLGLGDMLFLPPGASRLARIHGALVEEAEVRRVASFLKKQARPVFNEEVLKEEEEASGLGAVPGAKRDELFEQAARLVVSMGQASVSHLQRRLSLGYARAARLMDSLEAEGFVGPPEGSKPRQVLVPPDYFEQIEEERAP